MNWIEDGKRKERKAELDRKRRERTEIAVKEKRKYLSKTKIEQYIPYLERLVDEANAVLEKEVGERVKMSSTGIGGSEKGCWIHIGVEGYEKSFMIHIADRYRDFIPGDRSFFVTIGYNKYDLAHDYREIERISVKRITKKHIITMAGIIMGRVDSRPLNKLLPGLKPPILRYTIVAVILFFIIRSLI